MLDSADTVAIQQVVAGWIAVAFHHALASTDPIVYGPNTLALADSLNLYLLSLGYEIKPMDPRVKSLTESVVTVNAEKWRQKILAEMGVTYRALSAGPADWRALEASFTILSRYSWAARQGYVCPTTWPPDPVHNDGKASDV
jgi:hypothetical protein